eukprot:m.34446 g.34446  ORF g.34446 m.34446 type:complete len:154 (+) comp13056_c0_seq2:39-500(+)
MSALLRARLLLQQHSQHASGALLRFRAPLCSTARLQSETHNSNKDQQRGTQEKFGFITSPGTLRQAAEHLLSKEQVPPQAFFYALMNCQNRNLNCRCGQNQHFFFRLLNTFFFSPSTVRRVGPSWQSSCGPKPTRTKISSPRPTTTLLFCEHI